MRQSPNTIGVVGLAGLYLIDAARERVTIHDPIDHEGASLGSLLACAQFHGMKQLWIHESWAQLSGMWYPTIGGNFRNAVEPGWHTDPEPHVKAYRYHGVWRGAGPYYACDVLLPWLDTSRSSWKRAEDAEELAEAIRAYDHALKFDFMVSPGGTGTSLIRALHPEESGGHAIPLEAPHLPFVAKTTALLEPAWINAGIEHPEQYKYLHMLDKHGAWLGACNSLWLGYGDIVHARRSEELTAMWMGADSPTRRSPGYWCVSGIQGFEGIRLHREAPSLEMLIDPGLFHARHPYGALWLLTPTMQVLREEGYVPEVIEAYYWPEAHQMLQPWYKRIRDAREELGERADMAITGNALARRCLKELYTQTFGWLAPQTWKRDEAHPLVRPDWRHAIIAEGEARLWRQAMKAARNGVLIAAIDYDAWIILSNEEEPEAVAAQAGIKLGSGIGEWDVKCSLFTAGFETFFHRARHDDGRIRARAHADLMDAIYTRMRMVQEVPF